MTYSNQAEMLMTTIMSVKRSTSIHFLALLICGLATTQSEAVTLQELLDGATLQTQDLMWDNWTWSGPADPARIDVTLNTSQASQPRLVFNGPDNTINPPFSTPAGGSQMTQFQYDVRTISGADLINGSSLHLTGAGVRPGGHIRVTANSQVASLEVSSTAIAEGNTIFIGNDAESFAPQDSITVTNQINLTGGPQNFPGRTFATILASFDQGFSVLQPSCEDLLRNSVEVKSGTLVGPVFVPGSGNWVRAIFKPPGGLNRAEQACGVDHFSWTNRITQHPESWDWVAIDRQLAVAEPPIGRFQQVRDADEGRLFDPFVNAPGEDLTYGVITGVPDPFSVTGDTIRVPVPWSIPLDTRMPYWQEIPGNNYVRGSFMGVPVVDGDISLMFMDRPSYNDAWLLPTDATRHLRFVTRLVGVDTNGDVIKQWSALQTNFAWSTNAIAVTNFASFVPDSDNLPEIVSGGVFDVQLVPEPPAILLSTAFFFSLLAWRWLRLRKLVPHIP